MSSSRRRSSLKESPDGEVCAKATTSTQTSPFTSMFSLQTSGPHNSNPAGTTESGDTAALSPKWKNWWVRLLWTAVMILGATALLFSGHVWVILLVIVIQVQVFKEVINIAHVPSKEKKLPLFGFINWYFLLSTNYFLYGESIIHYFKQTALVDIYLMPLAAHHRFISFSLYVGGFVLFVVNLKKGHYKFQFAQFAWTHMTLLMVVCQSHFIINNIFEGLVWFVLPVSLVVVNDIMAYVFGFFLGKTPLIHLSPKKTWEGFLGAFGSTMVWGFFFAGVLAQYPYMTCPMLQITENNTCWTHPVFQHHTYPIPSLLIEVFKYSFGLNVKSVKLYPLQFHALAMAVFASLIAPFGGFFASGVKRAFKLKDFGDSIPGHGGLTDRMDCQFLMGLFSYIYYQSFIGLGISNIDTILQAFATLGPQEQVEVFNSIEKFLKGQSSKM